MKSNLSISNQFLIATLSVIGIIFLGFEYNRTGDFYIYVTSSANIFSTPNLYLFLYGDPPVFPHLGNPFLTFHLFPFTYFPIKVGALIWKLISLILLFRLWILIKEYFPQSFVNSKKAIQWQLISFLVCFFPIYMNLHMVQFTIFMLFLSFEGLRSIEKGNWLFGSFLITMAIFVKVSPIVLLPYLFYRRHFKSGFAIFLFSGLFYLTPALLLGLTKNNLLWETWWHIINPELGDQVFDLNNRKNHSLISLESSLFIKDITDNIVNLEDRRYLIDLGKENVKYLIYFTRAFFIFLTLYFLNSEPFTIKKYNENRFYELSYLFLAINLIFPQQRLYNFIFLLPAISYLLFQFFYNRHAIKNYRQKCLIFIIAAVILNLELIYGVGREYYWHYKTVTYASIIITILLALMKPKIISIQK